MKKISNLKHRINKLKKLLKSIEHNEELIYEALYLDLGKSRQEAYLTEILPLVSEINSFIKNLSYWERKGRKVSTPLTLFYAKSRIYREAYGRILILSPWNYPLNLSLIPMVGAFSAGNKVYLKLSQKAYRTSWIIRRIIGEVFDSDEISVFDVRVGYDNILNLKYDLIFFTGSKVVGRKIMEKASKTLTPVILELGGKSPCYVRRDANLKLAAKRIVWGKMLNAGQTCVAPDYIMVDEDIFNKFIEALRKEIEEYNEKDVSKGLRKLVNKEAFYRICGYLNESKTVIRGKIDEENLFMSLSLVINPSLDSKIMKEEIFGMALPIIKVKDEKEAGKIIINGDKPLACYVFTKDNKVANRFMRKIDFGGGCINDTILHILNDKLPFGGVGLSGMGRYHGYYSYKAFTYEKSVLKSSTLVDMPFRYPPYGRLKMKLIRWINKF